MANPGTSVGRQVCQRAKHVFLPDANHALVNTEGVRFDVVRCGDGFVRGWLAYLAGLRLKNTLREFFDGVRQAITHALDRETLIQEIFLGRHQAARGILPPGMPGYNPQLKALEYQPTRARELLAKAGFPDGRGFPPLAIWSSVKSERIEAELLAVKRQLAAVGIPAEINYETDWPTFSKQLAGGRYPMFVYAWFADVPDPDNFLYKLFYSRSPRNLTGYVNPIVDDLLSEGRREHDVGRRIEVYRRAEQIIVDDAPVVPVWHYTYERLFQSYVRNVEVNGLGDAYMPLRRMWLEVPR